MMDAGMSDAEEEEYDLYIETLEVLEKSDEDPTTCLHVVEDRLNTYLHDDTPESRWKIFQRICNRAQESKDGNLMDYLQKLGNERPELPQPQSEAEAAKAAELKNEFDYMFTKFLPRAVLSLVHTHMNGDATECVARFFSKVLQAVAVRLLFDRDFVWAMGLVTQITDSRPEFWATSVAYSDTVDLKSHGNASVAWIVPETVKETVYHWYGTNNESLNRILSPSSLFLNLFNEFIVDFHGIDFFTSMLCDLGGVNDDQQMDVKGNYNVANDRSSILAERLSHMFMWFDNARFVVSPSLALWWMRSICIGIKTVVNSIPEEDRTKMDKRAINIQIGRLRCIFIECYRLGRVYSVLHDLTAEEKHNFVALTAELENSMAELDRITLWIASIFLDHKSIGSQLSGLADIATFCELATGHHISKYDGKKERAPQPEKIVGIRYEELIQWLREKHILDRLSHEDTHEQIIRHSVKIFKFAVLHGLLEDELVARLWGMCVGDHARHISGVQVILQAFQDMVQENGFNWRQREYIHSQLVQMKQEDYTQPIVQLICKFAMGTVMELQKPHDEHSALAQDHYGLELLWRGLTQRTDNQFDGLIVQFFQTILITDNAKQFRKLYFDKCVDNISKHVNVPKTIYTLHVLLTLYSTTELPPEALAVIAATNSGMSIGEMPLDPKAHLQRMQQDEVARNYQNAEEEYKLSRLLLADVVHYCQNKQKMLKYAQHAIKSSMTLYKEILVKCGVEMTAEDLDLLWNEGVLRGMRVNGGKPVAELLDWLERCSKHLPITTDANEALVLIKVPGLLLEVDSKLAEETESVLVFAFGLFRDRCKRMNRDVEDFPAKFRGIKELWNIALDCTCDKVREKANEELVLQYSARGFPFEHQFIQELMAEFEPLSLAQEPSAVLTRSRCMQTLNAFFRSVYGLFDQDMVLDSDDDESFGPDMDEIVELSAFHAMGDFELSIKLNNSVHGLKRKVVTAMAGFHPDLVRLLLNGEELDDENVLVAHCAVPAGSQVLILPVVNDGKMRSPLGLITSDEKYFAALFNSLHYTSEQLQADEAATEACSLVFEQLRQLPLCLALYNSAIEEIEQYAQYPFQLALKLQAVLTYLWDAPITGDRLHQLATSNACLLLCRAVGVVMPAPELRGSNNSVLGDVRWNCVAMLLRALRSLFKPHMEHNFQNQEHSAKKREFLDSIQFATRKVEDQFNAGLRDMPRACAEALAPALFSFLSNPHDFQGIYSPLCTSVCQLSFELLHCMAREIPREQLIGGICDMAPLYLNLQPSFLGMLQLINRGILQLALVALTSAEVDEAFLTFTNILDAVKSGSQVSGRYFELLRALLAQLVGDVDCVSLFSNAWMIVLRADDMYPEQSGETVLSGVLALLRGLVRRDPAGVAKCVVPCPLFEAKQDGFAPAPNAEGLEVGSLDFVRYLWNVFVFAPCVFEDLFCEEEVADGEGCLVRFRPRRGVAWALPPNRCVTKASRKQCFELLLLLCQRGDNVESSHDYSSALRALLKSAPGAAPTETQDDYVWGYDHQRTFRSTTDHFCGIQNLGCICYMTTVFQQLFHTEPFTRALLRMEDSSEGGADGKEAKEEDFVRELRKMLAMMAVGGRQTIDPSAFCISYKDQQGNSVNPLIQMDADEFMNLLFSRLEHSSKPIKTLIDDCFKGEQCNRTTCSECGAVSERTEAFYTLSVEVKNRNSLPVSLGAYKNEERLSGDNKFMCSSCQKKVIAVKQTFLDSVPPFLICVLKRFDFNYVEMTKFKLTENFEFPQELDMSPYCIQKPDAEYGYRLRGIMVHSGYADAGHYYSYIRIGDSDRWLEFNDHNVRPFDPNTIQEKCFGGTRYVKGRQVPIVMSAYSLFYERNDVKINPNTLSGAALLHRKQAENIWNDCQMLSNLVGRFDPGVHQLTQSLVWHNVEHVDNLMLVWHTLFHAVLRGVASDHTDRQLRKWRDLLDVVSRGPTSASALVTLVSYLGENQAYLSQSVFQLWLQSPIPEIRMFVSEALLIICKSCFDALLTDAPRVTAETPTQELLPGPLVTLLDALMRPLLNITRHWRHFEGYFRFWRDLAEHNAHIRLFLLERHFVADLFSVWKATSPVHLIQYIKEHGSDSEKEQHAKNELSKLWQMGTQNTKADFSYVVGAIEVLMLGAVPQAQDVEVNRPLMLDLVPGDEKMRARHKVPYDDLQIILSQEDFTAWLGLGGSCAQSACRILTHISTGTYQFATATVGMLHKGLYGFYRETEYYGFIELLASLLTIDDAFTEKRVNELLSLIFSFIKRLEAQYQQVGETGYVARKIKTMINVVEKAEVANPEVQRWLERNRNNLPESWGFDNVEANLYDDYYSSQDSFPSSQ